MGLLFSEGKADKTTLVRFTPHKICSVYVLWIWNSIITVLRLAIRTASDKEIDFFLLSSSPCSLHFCYSSHRSWSPFEYSIPLTCWIGGNPTVLISSPVHFSMTWKQATSRWPYHSRHRAQATFLVFLFIFVPGGAVNMLQRPGRKRQEWTCERLIFSRLVFVVVTRWAACLLMSSAQLLPLDMWVCGKRRSLGRCRVWSTSIPWCRRTTAHSHK